MSEPSGAAVVIIGGGVTGLSAGWWLARAGVDVLVLERGIVGWEASGRNGGGATHVYSPFGLEEQRLWPQMDDLLGYPTEYQPRRIGVALTEPQWALARRWAEIGEMRGFRWESLDRRQLKELVPIVGDNAIGGTYLHFGGHANPQRTVQAYAWALQDHGGRILARQQAAKGVPTGRKAEPQAACGEDASARGVAALGSVEGDAQPEVDHVLLPAGRERPAAGHAQVPDPAVYEVGHGRKRDVAADPDIVPDARREPPARPFN